MSKGHASSRNPSRNASWAALVLAAVLAVFGLLLVFRSGAYVFSTWLPFMLVLGALAAVWFWAGPMPSSLRGSSLLLAVVFVLLCAWTFASMSWAVSPDNAWQEANRTLFYLLGVLLTLVAVRVAGRRGPPWVLGLVLVGVGAVGGTIVFNLIFSADPLFLFRGARLEYPVSYANGLGGLLMIGFWLAMGLAGSRGGGRVEGRRRDSGRVPGLGWIPAVLPALAVFLAGVALLTQSRGALWSFFLVLPFFIILSSHRFRAVFHLGLVVAALVLTWSEVAGLWEMIRGAEGVPAQAQAFSSALEAIGFSVLGVLVLSLAGYLVERSIGRLGPVSVRGIGVVLIIIALVGAGIGTWQLHRTTGSIDDFLQERWQQMTSDTGGAPGTRTRFTGVGLKVRLDLWEIAADAFREKPVLGLGAQNYEYYFYQHRDPSVQVQQPHSNPMRMLSELGLPGALLFLVLIGGTLLRGVWLRFRGGDHLTRTVAAAASVAVLSWFIHSSGDWLWQLAGVSWPALLLMGTLLGIELNREQRGDASTASLDSAWSAVSGTTIRRAGLALALVALVSAFLPFLSLRYLDLARLNAASAPETAIANTRMAERFNPFSPQPPLARAYVYRTQNPADLQKAVRAQEEAVEKEPQNWLLNYRAALAIWEYPDALEGEKRAKRYLQKAMELNPGGVELRSSAVH